MGTKVWITNNSTRLFKMSDLSVLIISDEEAIRESLQFVLNEEGYSCFTSPNFKNAMQLLQGNSADIVLLDCRIPRSNSINIIRELKKIIPEVPIIIITSYADSEFAYRALQNGASHNLFKPLDFDELMGLLKALV